MRKTLKKIIAPVVAYGLLTGIQTGLTINDKEKGLTKKIIKENSLYSMPPGMNIFVYLASIPGIELGSFLYDNYIKEN